MVAYAWNRFTSVTPAEIREARVSALRSDDKGEESLVSVLDLIDDVVFAVEATNLENVKEIVRELRDELDELRDEKRETEDERDALLTERDELASRLAKAEADGVSEAVIAERDKALADVKTLESAIQRMARDYDRVFNDARLEVRRVGNKMLVSLPKGLGKARTLVVPVFTDRNAVHFTSRGK